MQETVSIRLYLQETLPTTTFAKFPVQAELRKTDLELRLWSQDYISRLKKTAVSDGQVIGGSADAKSAVFSLNVTS